MPEHRFNRCRRGFGAAIVGACLAVASILAGPAEAQWYTHEWYTGTGLRPTETCPPWILFETANVEVPDYNPVRLRLSTSSSGEVMMYSQEGAGVPFQSEGSTHIQFRMRYVSGSTSDTTRRVASVLFQTGDPTPRGNILWIGLDEIFLWSADAVIGARAFVDTDNAYHTYRINWSMDTDSIRVYRDNVATPVLTGVAISRPAWTSYPRIVWGHQFFGAQGESRWQLFSHNASWWPGGTDYDYAPDSCDNCQFLDNTTQDDIDRDGLGNACDTYDTLQFTLQSPVDMVVTDPSLDSIGKVFNFILDGSTYTDNTDTNGDGDPDDIVTIPRPLSGQYLVRIFPEPNADPNDTYTLTIRINGNQLITPEGHEDAKVSSLPAVFVWNAAGTLAGDANADGNFTAADIIYMVNHIFKGGPGPVVPGHGDVNCDNVTTSSDVIRLVNFIFKSSIPPCSRTANYDSQ